jgi:hypothetical protein
MLNDDQQRAILAAAQPLDPQRQHDFLSAVCERLQALPEVGDGSVARVVREAQREFFDPPNMSTGPGRHFKRPAGEGR